MIDISTKIPKEKTKNTGLKGVTVHGLKNAIIGHMIMQDRKGYRYVEVGLSVEADTVIVTEEKERPVFKNAGSSGFDQVEIDTKVISEERTVRQYVIPIGSEITIKSDINGKETWKLAGEDITRLINQLDVMIPLENEC